MSDRDYKPRAPKGVKKPAKPRKLTPKQQQFVNEYLKTGNGAQSASKVYNIGGRHGISENSSADNVAGTIANQNLNKPIIQQAIEGRMKARELSADFVIEELLRDATDEVYREKNPAVRVKTLELLGKIKRLFVDRVDAQVLLADVTKIGWGSIEKDND